jgi:dTDP-4-amino-4,6-dideoxygalactose transaminase
MAVVRQDLLVPYTNFKQQYAAIGDELLAAVQRVLQDGDFILGSQVERFEHAAAEYCGVRHAIGVANGTDALVMALKALGIGPGDEVITAPNSFLASASAIALAGATPRFADVRDDYNIDPDAIERAIGPRTKGLMPVHLTGRPADMNAIRDIARRRGLVIVEDAAQAIGATYHGRRVGGCGDIGCFSLHPLKNLNAAGDAGLITTDDDRLAGVLRQMRNHGLRNRNEADFWGFNSRLDTVQAAMLNVRFRYLEGVTEARRTNAAFYAAALHHVVEVPRERDYERCVYHTFVVQCDRRDALQAHLLAQGVETKVHYPIPIHLQRAAGGLGYRKGDFPVAERQADRSLTLPNYPELTEEQKQRVVSSICRFYEITP